MCVRKVAAMFNDVTFKIEMVVKNEIKIPLYTYYILFKLCIKSFFFPKTSKFFLNLHRMDHSVHYIYYVSEHLSNGDTLLLLIRICAG